MGPSGVIEPGVSDEASSAPTMTTEEEKREKTLVWKIDLHILPFVVLLYLFSFLDRGLSSDSPSVFYQMLTLAVNIGNARLYGMEEDLGLVGDQYQIAVSILFVTYCVCQSLELAFP